jgi:hypothetical protein
MKTNEPNSNPTEPIRLTPAQLLELASADALGLLDEGERRDFEAGFAEASPRVQQLIREQQLREAHQFIATLPERAHAHPERLRLTVLERIYALLGVEQGLAGRIGGRAGVPAADVALARTLAPTRGVNHWWRAGTIGSLAAAVLLGVVSLQLWGQFNRLDEAIRNNTVTEVFAKDFGPRFETALLSPKTKFVQFASYHGDGGSSHTPEVASAGATDDQGTGKSQSEPMAVLLIDGQTGTGHLFCRDLPSGRAFTLTIISPDGEARRVVLTFNPSSARAAVAVQSIDILPGSVLEVTSSESKRPVLKSVRL